MSTPHPESAPPPSEAAEPASVETPAADSTAPQTPAAAAEPAEAAESAAETAAPEAAQAEAVAPEAAAAEPAAATVPPQQYPADMARFRPLPPPPPGFMEARWKGPDYAGGPAAWIAALIGGLATAIMLPLSRPGLGWLLVGLVMAGAVVHAARFGPKPDSRGERLVRIGWGVVALALLSVGTFRAAGWLVVFCTLGALACASLAVAGGRSVRAVLFASIAAPIAALRAIPWLARGLASWHRSREKSGTFGRVLLSLLVTVILLVVFGALFASADAAFAKLLGDILPKLDGRTIARGLIYTTVGGLLTAGAIFLVLAPPDLSGMERPSPRRIGRIELALPLGGLVLMFGAFVALQVRNFFGDKAYIEKTTGLTYSQYAVRGFGQLLVVTLLTLIIIGLVSRWASRETSADRTLLRTLLGLLVVLSMVIVGSAVWRMWLYQNTYGWTRERLFFGSVELYLGGVFVLVALAGWKLRATWFPRAAVAGFAALLLGLAVANPEHFIAEQNVERVKKIDFWYLRALGPDAAPALAKLDEPLRSCALSWMDRELKQNPEQWYSWNLSRAQAREQLAGTFPRPTTKTCSAAEEQYRSSRD
ncbi:hypothetical protein Cs7R123_39040 [Catellatospora sp. TT07R-123]|uniref:DUF4153 domain-containing protein n=1 Tax=Catellatospora sp. TT07R-123 TaxID=2733863 RepID=UPI001B03E6FF|nr:DUF4173 domain-containing protein [Catellatospora sp. TT07R-123]GHJ46562.1 hypothetical protein Cs7R123_39040 [Catellatospora sp. TT07R-123]